MNFNYDSECSCFFKWTNNPNAILKNAITRDAFSNLNLDIAIYNFKKIGIAL